MMDVEFEALAVRRLASPAPRAGASDASGAAPPFPGRELQRRRCCPVAGERMEHRAVAPDKLAPAPRRRASATRLHGALPRKPPRTTSGFAVALGQITHSRATPRSLTPRSSGSSGPTRTLGGIRPRWRSPRLAYGPWPSPVCTPGMPSHEYLIGPDATQVLGPRGEACPILCVIYESSTSPKRRRRCAFARRRARGNERTGLRIGIGSGAALGFTSILSFLHPKRIKANYRDIHFLLTKRSTPKPCTVTFFESSVPSTLSTRYTSPGCSGAPCARQRRRHSPARHVQPASCKGPPPSPPRDVIVTRRANVVCTRQAR